MKIALIAANGKYVCAEQGGGLVYSESSSSVKPLYANRSAIGIWETFDLINNGNGTVSLKTWSGHYWSAEESGGFGLSTNRTEINAWEEFRLTKLGEDKIGLRCIDAAHFVCAELSSNQELNCTRTEIGAWETFEVISLEEIPDKTEKELRNFKGNFCGMVIPELQYGPARMNGRILFTPAYVVENANTRAVIRSRYLDAGYTHFPINVYSSVSIYRNVYPIWDDKIINQYLEELWHDGLVPVCSVFPDNSTQFNPNLDSSLVKIAFWWEDSHPIVGPENNSGNKFWLIQQQYPKAIIYWHNPPYQDAPYVEYSDWGLQQDDKSVNSRVWNYVVRNNNVKGILFQGQAWNPNETYEGWMRSALNMQDYIPRFHGNMYGLPEKLDIIDFEETAYYLFNMNGDVSQALNWVNRIRDLVEVDGFCNG